MELKDLDTTQDPTASGYRYARSYDGGKYVPHSQRYHWPIVVVYAPVNGANGKGHQRRRARKRSHRKRY